MAEHTKEPWVFTRFLKVDGGDIETIDDVVEALTHSARKSDRAELWGVTCGVEQDDPDFLTVMCHTGNGPTSEERARRIAAEHNAHDDLVAVLKKCVDQSDDFTCTGLADAFHEARALLAKLESEAE